MFCHLQIPESCVDPGLQVHSWIKPAASWVFEQGVFTCFWTHVPNGSNNMEKDAGQHDETDQLMAKASSKHYAMGKTGRALDKQGTENPRRCDRRNSFDTILQIQLTLPCLVENHGIHSCWITCTGVLINDMDAQDIFPRKESPHCSFTQYSPRKPFVYINSFLYYLNIGSNFESFLLPWEIVPAPCFQPAMLPLAHEVCRALVLTDQSLFRVRF